jgi:hypothetical protein
LTGALEAVAVDPHREAGVRSHVEPDISAVQELGEAASRHRPIRPVVHRQCDKHAVVSL